jgi:hypothetical protein
MGWFRDIPENYYPKMGYQFLKQQMVQGMNTWEGEGGQVS